MPKTISMNSARHPVPCSIRGTVRILTLIAFLGSIVSIAAEPIGAESVNASLGSQKKYVRNAQAQIDALSARLRKADRQLQHLRSSARRECQTTLSQLWKKEKLARLHLESIRKAPAAQWQSLRKEEDSLLIRLKKSCQHLVNRYFK